MNKVKLSFGAYVRAAREEFQAEKPREYSLRKVAKRAGIGAAYLKSTGARRMQHAY